MSFDPTQQSGDYQLLREPLTATELAAKLREIGDEEPWFVEGIIPLELHMIVNAKKNYDWWGNILADLLARDTPVIEHTDYEVVGFKPESTEVHVKVSLQFQDLEGFICTEQKIAHTSEWGKLDFCQACPQQLSCLATP